MQVPKKQQTKRRLPDESDNSCIRHKPTHPNHVWGYDFVTDLTEDGRQLKLLVVLDVVTRKCLAVEAVRSFTARVVNLTLQYLFAVRSGGAPEHIRSDNGPEVVAHEIQRWLSQATVRTLLGANGYVESFNGTLRDELLSCELFLGLDEARYVLDEWPLGYNHSRPHSGINWQTPAAYAASVSKKADGKVPSALSSSPPCGAADKQQLSSLTLTDTRIGRGSAWWQDWPACGVVRACLSQQQRGGAMHQLAEKCLRIGTRSEKLTVHFLSMVKLAMIQRTIRVMGQA